ncbi:MAG: hypothetical protein D6752_02050 [Candidatus Nitrosothermus koennekii]|nr:MAG: hypothetical protein D6752_02050 [Candidatus Nitrosothermus koennekii]
MVCAANNKDTASYASREGIYVLQTPGKGYSLDLRYALETLKNDKVLVMPVDLPLVNSKLINYIIEKSYDKKGCICIMVKGMLIDKFGINNNFSKFVNGEELFYTGISIIDTSRMDNLEEEYIAIDDYRLAINVNTEHELRLVEDIFKDYLIASQSLHKS